MKRVLVGSAAVAVVLTALVLLRPGPSHRVGARWVRPAPVAALYGCDDRPVVRPVEFGLACGDGNASLRAMRWTRWTADQAVGTGSYVANDCLPFCAAGHFHRYPMTATLDRPLATPAGRLFSRMVLRFHGRGPDGQPVLVDEDLLPYDLVRGLG